MPYQVSVVNSKLATSDSVAVSWLNRLLFPTSGRRNEEDTHDNFKVSIIACALYPSPSSLWGLTAGKPDERHPCVAVPSHCEAFPRSGSSPSPRLLQKQFGTKLCQLCLQRS